MTVEKKKAELFKHETWGYDMTIRHVELLIIVYCLMVSTFQSSCHLFLSTKLFQYNAFLKTWYQRGKALRKEIFFFLRIFLSLEEKLPIVQNFLKHCHQEWIFLLMITFPALIRFLHPPAELLASAMPT